MSYLCEAFHKICKNAVKGDSRKWYVTLRENVATYGGPEEGGWYNHSSFVVAVETFTTEEAAQEAYNKVQLLSQELSQQRLAHDGKHCLETLEWLEARGLEPDFLPNPDRTDYSVSISNEAPKDYDARGMRWGDYEA